ncbi:MAG TPA: alpha/beta fold hydrolase [Burkholderiales bacterium]|nr:alpha/beta fold hydrolase [Burkholderiales bacterium]
MRFLAFALLWPALALGAVDSKDAAFLSQGFRLFGTLTVPAGSAPGAAVLIIPGTGPVDRDGSSKAAPQVPPVYKMWAERLGDAGIAALRYDKRYLTYTDIDAATLDQDAQIADAVAALRYLRTQVPGKPIFVIGHSEGGMMAPLVAQRTGAAAGVIVINAAQFPIDELVIEQVKAGGAPQDYVDGLTKVFARIKDGSFPPRGQLLGAGQNYWKQWIKYSTESTKTLSRSKVPVLLVQCMDDETLPGATLERNVKALRSVQKAQLRLLKDHDHLGMAVGSHEPSPEFMRTLINWISTASRAPAAPSPSKKQG